MYGNWDFSSFTKGDRAVVSDTVNTAQVILGDPSGSSFLVSSPVDGVMVYKVAEIDYTSAPTLSNSNGSITVTKLASSGGGGSAVSGSLIYDTTNDLWKIGASGSECEIITTCSLSSHLPSGTISGSSQLAADISGSLSAAAIVSLGAGILSGSSADGAISSSAQIVNLGANIVSGAAQIVTLTSHTETFSSATAVSASHNLGTKNVTVSVYTNDDFMIFPTSIKTHDTNNVYVSFNSSRSGRVVITK